MIPLLNINPDELASMQIVDWGYTEKLEPSYLDEYYKWIELGLHGPLNYLADHRKEKREHLKNVYPKCESAIVFLFDYSHVKKSLSNQESEYKVAGYSMGFEGKDYHYWIKEKLNHISSQLQKENANLETKISLDVHPVLERDLAFRSGLGWFGKNSMLINQKFGSYTIIGSLLLNQKLGLNQLNLDTDHCGTCTRCIDACPTNAIDGDQKYIDANKCISTYTIELFKDAPAPKGFPTESNEVFGCDICQEVCPWNSRPINTASNIQLDELVDFFNREISLIVLDIENMSNKGFKTFFKETSFERLGKQGLLKNLMKYLNS